MISWGVIHTFNLYAKALQNDKYKDVIYEQKIFYTSFFFTCDYYHSLLIRAFYIEPLVPEFHHHNNGNRICLAFKKLDIDYHRII